MSTVDSVRLDTKHGKRKLKCVQWIPVEWVSFNTHRAKWTLCGPWEMRPLQWRHNDYDGVSNHQPHGCLLNRLLRRRSKKTSKLRVTGLCVGNSPGPVNSPHKGTVTRKMFPFDDVIIPRIHGKIRYKYIVVFSFIASHRWHNAAKTDFAKTDLHIRMSAYT